MVNVNKLLLSFVLVAAVVVKAEEATKPEVVEQNSETVAELKKLYAHVTSQENVDKAKEYTNQALEQTQKVFTQYPMYLPAAFFWEEHQWLLKLLKLKAHQKSYQRL